MKTGFLNLPAKVSTSDGRNLVFLEPLEFVLPNQRRYRIPAGAKTDGASTPRLIWWIIPPFGLPGNNYGPPSWGHDAAYQRTLEKLMPDGSWERITTAEFWDDKLILHLMAAQGVSWLMRWTIYIALHLFGRTAFKEDRKEAKLAIKPFLFILPLVIITVGAGCVMSGAQPASLSKTAANLPLPPKGGTPNTETPGAAVVPAVSATNGITLVISADFHPGHAINGFFSASGDLKYWNVIDYFPYPIAGATVSFTNSFTEEYQFFRAGYDY